MGTQASEGQASLELYFPDDMFLMESKQRDSTQSWGVVLDGMTQYDEKLVGDWKDDLNNLLVFVCSSESWACNLDINLL